MKEANFTTEVRKSLEELGVWSYKIPDAIRGPNTRFIPEKPFDVIASYKGIPIAIETKFMKSWRPFGKEDFQKSQLKELTNFQKKGQGRSFVLLNIRTPKKENVCIIFEWWAFESDLKSRMLSVQELKDVAKVHSIKGKNGLYNFQVFLDRYVSI